VQAVHHPGPTYGEAQSARDQGSTHVRVRETARRSHGHNQQPRGQTASLRFHLHRREEPKSPTANEHGSRSVPFEITKPWAQNDVAEHKQEDSPHGEPLPKASGPQVRDEDR